MIRHTHRLLRMRAPIPFLRPFTTPLRTLSSTPSLRTSSMNDAESNIAKILTDKLAPTELLVQDISGGCGSMYAIEIASHAFKGANMLKQQRMVNAALGDLVKEWHGVQLRTKVPDA